MRRDARPPRPEQSCFAELHRERGNASRVLKRAGGTVLQHRRLALHDDVPIDGDVAGGNPDPEFLGASDRLQPAGAFVQDLGGDAALEQARAAEPRALFHQQHAAPRTGESHRGRRATRPATDHQHVDFGHIENSFGQFRLSRRIAPFALKTSI